MRLPGSFKKWAFSLHLWSGLTLGFYLVVMGLTGTFLVFNRETDTAFNSYLTSKNVGKAPAPFGEIVATFEREAQGKPLARIHQKSADGVWGMTLSDNKSIARHIYVDPHSVQIVGIRTRTSSFNGWVSWLHFNLYAGQTGELVNGILGLASLTLLGTGLYLWLPPGVRKIRNRLSLKAGASTKKKLHDWHNLVGFASFAILALTALTGAILVWQKPVENAVFALTNSREPAKPRATPAGERLNVSTLFEIGERAIPGAWVSSVDLPKKAGDPFIVRKNLPDAEQWRGSWTAFVDPYSGRILRTQNTRQMPLGRQIMELNFPLHTGWWGGLFTKILYAMAGLAPLALFMTGLWKWALRRRALAQHRRVSAAPAPPLGARATLAVSSCNFRGDGVNQPEENVHANTKTST